LTEALTKLIENHALCADMGNSGRRLAQAKFSPEAATKNLINVYREICPPAARVLDQVTT
jgi:glycosyltransferase involved in cell wall biosynthesis